MGLFFIYSLKVALCLTAFYLVYKLLLSRETFFGFNRAVLLGIIGVSLLLPSVRFTVESAPEPVGGFVIVEDIVMQAVAADAPGFSVTAAQVCFAIYIIGVAFFAGREAWSLLCLRRMLRGGRVVSSDGGVKTVVVKGDVSPFSWMGNIVVSEKDYRDNPEYILLHERAHIAGRHSWDILLCDVLIVFQWFNPAAWLLKAELQSVHEYEADRRVLSSGVNAADYQLLLIRKAVGDKLFSMANNLNQSSLKKRITMMLKKKSNPWSRARMLVAVPVAAVAVVAFATPKAESLSNEIKSESEALVSKVMPVVQAQAATPASAVAELPVQRAESVAREAEAQPEAGAPEAVAPGDDDKVYDIVEQQPEFPGGPSAMAKWLGDNIKYPAEAAKNNIQGRVIVQFVVGSDGTVGGAKIMRGVDPLLDQEALRVINAMPKWTPGKQDGKVVAVKYTIPVTFRQDGGAADGKAQPDGLKGHVVKINGKNYVPDDTQSVNLEGSPYYVVDGKPVDDISNINVNDIKQINVYKDVPSTPPTSMATRPRTVWWKSLPRRNNTAGK